MNPDYEVYLWADSDHSLPQEGSCMTQIKQGIGEQKIKKRGEGKDRKRKKGEKERERERGRDNE
jgi:hypothetical protein